MGVYRLHWSQAIKISHFELHQDNLDTEDSKGMQRSLCLFVPNPYNGCLRTPPDLSSPYFAFWADSGTQMCANLSNFEQICATLRNFRPLWMSLCNFAQTNLCKSWRFKKILCESVQLILDESEKFWTNVIDFERICATICNFWQICANQSYFEQIWAIWEDFEQICVNVSNFWRFWMDLCNSVQFLTILNEPVQLCTTLDKSLQIWAI